MTLKAFLLVLGSVVMTTIAQVCMKIDARRYADVADVARGAGAAGAAGVAGGAPASAEAASSGTDGTIGLMLSLWHQVTSPLTLAALVAYGLSTLCWLLALRTLPLSTAYIFSGLTIIVVTLASVAVLGETMNPTRWFALVLTVVGISLFARH